MLQPWFSWQKQREKAIYLDREKSGLKHIPIEKRILASISHSHACEAR